MPDEQRKAARDRSLRRTLIKVPLITAFFWLIKVLTTGMGETTSDYLVRRFVPQYAVVVAFVVFAGVLVLQCATRRYIPWVYWLTVVMVSVFGTMAADVVHIVFHVPYIVSTVFFTVVLAAVFGLWYASERTLSIHSIYTLRRELFYWAAVLTTFALGTAAGDLIAIKFGLGFFVAGIVFAAIIAIPVIGYWKFGMNAVLAFWFAYIFTRPLGASFADWMALSPQRGGLGWGTGPVSVVLAVLIAVLVGYLSLTHVDVDADELSEVR